MGKRERATELHRTRLLELEARMRPARVISSVAILVAILASVPWLGWWPLAVIAIPPVALLVSDRFSRTSLRPQLWVLLGVVTGVSVAAATGSIITGGISSPVIVLFLIPALSVALRFEGRLFAIGAAVLLTAVGITALSDLDAIGDDPAPLFFLLAALVSITVVVRTVKQLEIDQRVEMEMESLRKDFFDKITHDLRSPITSIRGYIDIVADGEAGAVNDDQRRFLSVATANTERLEGLIDNLLTASKLDAGVELDRREIDVVELIDALVLSLQPVAEARSLRLEVVAPERFTLCADRSALERVITNLVGNAAKFSPDGGRIVVSVQADGEFCTVSVTDEGPGIPADELDRLGTRYFRASTGADTKGTGLGLAITREIAELHGGRLEVKSELGEGATFSVLLPVATEPASPTRSESVTEVPSLTAA